MKVSAYTLGCKVNQYDTTSMTELLAGAGFEIVPWGEDVDIYLVNTCTVTNTADKKSRNMIRRALRQNPDAVVCVCGCLAQKEASELLETAHVSAVIGTADRGRIVEIVMQCLEGRTVNAVGEIAQQQVYEELSVKTSGELTRGYIKIQEGCDNFCSYCIIPYVRGRVRSRASIDIEKEARVLAQSGVKEIVLTGIHISSYGRDNGEKMIDLIGKLNKVEGILRIRLGSLEPQILTEDFLCALAENKKVCPHFHVSLQSGSDAVLQRMKRRYTAERYAGFIDAIRRHYDDPAITTDIITGFPQETEQEFLETCRFAETIGFSRVHVFPYSERAGTLAADMDGKIPVSVRKERAQKLIGIAQKMESAYAQCFVGTGQDVLFEQVVQGDIAEGYTSRYLRVHAQGGRAGACQKVLLCGVNGDIITGEILSWRQ